MSRPFHALAGAFHDAWAEGLDDPAVRFFNYGFHDPDVDPLRLSPDEEPHRLHLNLVRHLLRGVELTGRAVLEISSGRGGACEFLAARSDAARVVGIDRCAGNVRLARRRVSPSQAAFVVGDAEALPLRAGSFDVVIDIEASHCYGRFDRFLQEVDRVLRPGGTFCFTDLWDVPLTGVDWDARRALVRTVGWEVVREEDVAQGVRRALELEGEGIFRFLDAARPGTGRILADRVAALSRDLRVRFATGLASYPLWQLRKPPIGEAP